MGKLIGFDSAQTEYEQRVPAMQSELETAIENQIEIEKSNLYYMQDELATFEDILNQIKHLDSDIKIKILNQYADKIRDTTELIWDMQTKLKEVC